MAGAVSARGQQADGYDHQVGEQQPGGRGGLGDEEAGPARHRFKTDARNRQ